MEPITAIIVDDEKHARNVLANLIQRLHPEVDIIKTCSNLEEGVENIKALNPQLVFLDVQMPNYAGYEIVNFFESITFDIIFVTAFDQYAVKAFEVNAIDYLVKPIDRNRLKTAIQRVAAQQHLKKQTVDYEILLKSIKEKKINKIVIPELGNRRVLNLSDIIAIEADGSYSKVYLKKNKEITISKNLKYFESVLPEESNFFRTHRAWMINLTHIKTLNKSDLTITLEDDIKAKLARGRIEGFEAIVT
ncbi:MAG: response regulator [Flavobacteriales bacterium]|jgi:two-component system LytT family response regulator|nr:response regulator [Flavobacteriales bacterium]